MSFRRAALLFPFLLAASGAAGADLPRRSAPPSADFTPPPVFAWRGLYAGVQGGGGFASFRDGGGDLVGAPTGGLIGLTLDYNFNPAAQLVLGGEIDFAFTGISRTTTPFWLARARGEVDDLFTARARAGYAFMDRALAYVTGGLAASKNTIEFAQGPFYGAQASFQPGWALGAGLEVMLTSNLSAKGEYLFTSTGSGRYFDMSRYAIDSGVNMSTVRGGVNYHF
jgi:outer membrane immunogenic protein